MKIINKIKHFINYGRVGVDITSQPQIIYRKYNELPIKAIWAIELPLKVNEKEYLNEEVIRDNLARKIADEIKKYMKFEQRPILRTGIETKKVEYMAEIMILDEV